MSLASPADHLRLPPIKSLNFTQRVQAADQPPPKRPRTQDDDLAAERDRDRDRDRESRQPNSQPNVYYPQHQHQHQLPHPQHPQHQHHQQHQPYPYQAYPPAYHQHAQDPTYPTTQPQHDYHQSPYQYHQPQYHVSDYQVYQQSATQVAQVAPRNPYQHHPSEPSPQQPQPYFSPTSPRGRPPSAIQQPPTWSEAPAPVPVPADPQQAHISPVSQYPAPQSLHSYEPSHQHYPPPQEPLQEPMRRPATVAAAPPTDDQPLATHPSLPDRDPDEAKRSLITAIVNHCNVIYTFASRYSSLSISSPHGGTHDPSRCNPLPAEVREMTQHAQLVLDLIDRVRGAKGGPPKQEDWDWAGSDDKRAQLNDPGYPSEEVTTVALQSPTRGLSGGGSYVYDDVDPEVRSEAERDMMTIRSKRSAAAAVAANAASNTNGNGGTMSGVMGAGGEKLLKKSRKRGRTPLPGKCHSCNIRETPEWRRGPDGARTLCNACGLHYAKLVRKRDKVLNSSSTAPPEVETRPVDMEMVRASTQQNRTPGAPLSPQAVEPQGHFMQQLSPLTDSGRKDESETTAVPTNSFSRPVSGNIPSHDAYQISNAAYSISSYSSLTPQRTMDSTQRQVVNQLPSWDGADNNGSLENRYIRDYRPTTSDERGGTL